MITAANVETWITDWLVRHAEVPASEIRLDRALMEYGLDSLQALQLSGRLEERLDRPLSPALAWEYPTIAALAAHLAAGGSGTLEDSEWSSEASRGEPRP